MPTPGFDPVASTLLLPLATRETGTYTSDPISPLGINDIVIFVHVTDVTGSPTVDCSIQVSSDGAAWDSVPGSATQRLTAIGNTTANAAIPPDAFIAITTTVGGTGTATYRALALIATT